MFSMTAVRFALCHHIKGSCPDVDIINGASFAEMNRVFKAKLTDLKKPRGLQNKVWLKIMLYFCRRGRENLRELKRDYFAIAVDAAGCRCVHQVKDELTKNRREEHEAEEGGLMYKTTKESTCPVKYISKLNPGYSALFQRPNDRYSYSIDRWYQPSGGSEFTR